MIDLNHASGCQYGGAVALPDTTALIAAAIDRALVARQRCSGPPHLRQHLRARPRLPAADPVRLPRGAEGRGPRLRAADLAHLRGRASRRGHRRRLAAARRLRPQDRARRRTAVRLLGPRRPVQGSHRRLPRRRAGAARLSRALGEQGARRLVVEGRGEARPHPLEAGLRRADRALPGLPRAAEPGALHRAQPRHHGALQRARAVRPQPRPDHERSRRRGGARERRRELLPRVAQERTSVLCRGGRSAGEWHGACAWQDRCWGAAA